MKIILTAALLATSGCLEMTPLSHPPVERKEVTVQWHEVEKPTPPVEWVDATPALEAQPKYTDPISGVALPRTLFCELQVRRLAELRERIAAWKPGKCITVWVGKGVRYSDGTVYETPGVPEEWCDSGPTMKRAGLGGQMMYMRDLIRNNCTDKFQEAHR